MHNRLIAYSGRSTYNADYGKGADGATKCVCQVLGPERRIKLVAMATLGALRNQERGRFPKARYADGMTLLLFPFLEHFMVLVLVA